MHLTGKRGGGLYSDATLIPGKLTIVFKRLWQQNCNKKISFELRLSEEIKKNTMKYFRPLSESMIQKLKQCHQAELDEEHEKPFTMEDMSYAVAPLFKRGLIEIKKQVVDNKVLHCIHLTTDGIEYLKKINPVEKHS